MYISLWQSLPPYFPLMKGRHSLCNVYPFNHPRKYYFYYARPGIYHLARKLNEVGVKKVLFPAYHHGVEVAAMRAGGAQLVFYNIHTSGDIDYADLERNITPQTGALYVIHYNGIPQDLNAIMTLKRKYGLVLIEDAALSLFARHGDNYVGEFGDVAIFCLYKTLPVPNGGMLVINRPELDIDARLRRPSFRSTMRRLAALTLCWCGGKVNGMGQQIHRVRANVKTFSSAVGLETRSVGDDRFDASLCDWGISRFSQFIIDRSDVDKIIRVRRQNFEYLSRLLATASSEIQPMRGDLPPGAVPLFFPVLLRNRRMIHQALLSQGIETSLFWRPLETGMVTRSFPEVALLRDRVLALPIHQDLSHEQITYLVEKLEAAFKAFGNRPAAA